MFHMTFTSVAIWVWMSPLSSCTLFYKNKATVAGPQNMRTMCLGQDLEQIEMYMFF